MSGFGAFLVLIGMVWGFFALVNAVFDAPRRAHQRRLDDLSTEAREYDHERERYREQAHQEIRDTFT